jgi:hypothetical protein
MNHMSRKQAHRAEWMGNFSDKVIHLNPRHAGRICWDTAAHYFNTGLGWQEAALRYATNVTVEA